MSSCFSREKIPEFLTKAERIQAETPSKLAGIVIAPEFEPGIDGLLKLLHLPLRFFSYQEWQDAPVRKSFAYVLPPEEPACLSPGPEVSSHSTHRLSREELREFIQLELDMAGMSRK